MQEEPPRPDVAPEHPPAGTTSQNAFREFVKDRLAPGLRARGFRGSGARFELPSETHWVLVGLQKSVGSTAGTVHFAVNLSVTGKAEWARHALEKSYLGDKPTGNAVGPGTEWARLGILAFGIDTWWDVRPDEPTDAIADEVLRLLDEHGLPWLRAAVERMP